MKKILFLSLLLLIGVAQVSAQRPSRYTKNLSVEDVEYKSVILSHPEVRQILMFVPVDLTIIDGEEGYIEISYPVVEEEYLRFGVRDDDKFIIGRNGDKETPKSSILCDKIPVRVTVSLPNLCRIFGNSFNANIDIFVEHDHFAPTLEICNGYSMSISGKSITAEESITIRNHGTLTFKVPYLNTTKLTSTTMDGFIYLHGSTNANTIYVSSAGIDNIDMMVECQDLSIFSRSRGVIRFTGSAENVSVSARRRSTATIFLSELSMPE